jgi:hypothetical protein
VLWSPGVVTAAIAASTTPTSYQLLVRPDADSPRRRTAPPHRQGREQAGTVFLEAVKRVRGRQQRGVRRRDGGYSGLESGFHRVEAPLDHLGNRSGYLVWQEVHDPNESAGAFTFIENLERCVVVCERLPSGGPDMAKGCLIDIDNKLADRHPITEGQLLRVALEPTIHDESRNQSLMD